MRGQARIAHLAVELGAQAAARRLIGEQRKQVGHFVAVARQVEHLAPVRIAGPESELGAGRADNDGGGDVVAGFEEVFGEERLAPVGDRAAREQGAPAYALGAGQRRDARKVKDGGADVNIQHQLIAHGGLGDQTRVAHEHGNTQALLVERALVAEAVLAEIEAVVAEKDDHGVGGEAELIEAIEDAPDARVGARDAAMVVALGGLAVIGDVGAVGRRDGQVRHGAADGVAVEIGGPVRRRGRPVRAFETDVKREGVAVIAVDEGERVIGGDVVHPAGGRSGRAVDVKGSVVVAALAEEARPEIEAGPVALLAHVPFADHAGYVARVAQTGGVGDGVGGEAGGVVDDAVEMIIAAGEDGGAAGRTKREGHEGVAETNALGGDAIHVRRAVGEPGKSAGRPHFALHDAQRVPALIIRDEEEEVGHSALRHTDGEERRRTGYTEARSGA